MSVENPEVANDDHNFVKPMNGGLNGVSNGHAVNSSGEEKSSGDEKHRSSSSSHKSSSKDKHRDKDRKSSSSSSRDKDRDKSRHSSSHHSSSSSSKDKEKSSSSSSHKSSRDKDRDKEKSSSSSRDKDKDKDKDKQKSSSSSSRDKDKDREKDKDRSKDKDRHRSNRDDKHKSSSSSSSHKDREKDKDKDKEKSTASSSNLDKDKQRDKDKDRSHKSSSSSSKSKHHSSSSSSKDKHRHSSSSKDKDRKERDRNHEKRPSSKKENGHDNNDKENTDGNDKEFVFPTNGVQDVMMKDEKQTLNEVIKREEESQYDCNGPIESDDNVSNKKSHYNKHNEIMNASQASSCDYSMSQFRKDEESFVIKEEEPSEIKEEDESVEEQDEDDPLKMDDTVKSEKSEDSEEDIPLSKRRKPAIISEDEEDDLPLNARKKVKKEDTKKAKKKKHISDEEDEDYDDEEDVKPKKKKMKKEKKEKQKEKVAPTKTKASVKQEIKSETTSPVKGGRKKKEEEVQDVWKWWEEEKREDGVKWNFLEHKGPVFAPEYIPLPDNVSFYYDGKKMKLSDGCEEVACFYAKMLEHEYTSKKAFNDNFFKDWRKFMSSKEKEKISGLEKCNFQEMCDYFKAQSEKNRNRTKQEKEAIKEENEKLLKEYGFCVIDGHKEKIGNFRIEPPGLFRGRGDHPKMGAVKRRVMPEDILINCSKDSNVPKPPPGHKWKEVRHDNTVTWLASWVENVQGQVKYIMLNPSSKLKGEKDYAKYETARRLHKTIDKIRSTYRDEWKSKEMRIRQRAVALYFIDKLALRAGNEKDEDQADTVGCCSLRVEHIQLHKELDGKENVVVFDFLGKDSIRYYNEVEVEKRVFKNLELFKENKKEGDDLFDRLNTSVLNEHLRELMEGLTAKVFRTYNASITLQRQLDELTDPDSSIPEKLLSYNRANRAVAILCNHQRSVPKSHGKSMENLKGKIQAKREAVDDCEVELKDAIKAAKRGSVKEKMNCDKKRKQLERLKEQLKKLELQETDRDENKTIALGTSKLNYLDPRISVAWCKKYGVPIEKIFNKTQRDKFRWAIEMADENYSFIK